MTQTLLLLSAIDDFIRGCKADGTFTSIKASCILGAWDNLNGALQPLVGVAPTNFNFVSGDYDRKTGLVGNGTTKYLDSNRNNNAEPQNSKHLAVFCSSASTASASARTYIGTSSSVAGASWLHGAGTSNNLSVRANTDTSLFDLPSSSALTGFIGVARGNSATSSYRYSGTTSSGSTASVSPGSESIKVFLGVSTASYSNARIAFYSIGESVDLAQLDTRVTNLINAIGAAIP